MLNLGAMSQVAIIYLSLSREGKRFLKKAVIKSSQLNKRLSKSIPSDLKKILYLVKNFKVVDKVFSSQVSDQLCFDLGRDKSAMYARFISLGCFNLLVWGKMLEAFNLVYDEEARERCIYIAFAQREWNDLADNQGYSFGELMVAAFDDQAAIPKQLTFLRQLKQGERKLTPPERFGKYYQHLQGVEICSRIEYTKEKAEIALNQVAPFVALIFMYIMVPEIPDGLKEASNPVGRWMYMLDELADLDHDKKANRVTYMAMVKDPEEEMRKQFEECRKIILRNASNPDKLIEFLEMITSRVIDARKQGIDIEDSFSNLS